MKTKKITFISLPGYHYYNPTYNDNVFGGAELQIYLITSELAKYPRHKINVLVTNDNKEKKEIINNIKVTQAFNTKKCKTKIIKSYKFYQNNKNITPFTKIKIFFTAWIVKVSFCLENLYQSFKIKYDLNNSSSV